MLDYTNLFFLNSIDWPNVIAIILGSGTVAAVVSGGMNGYLAWRANENNRREKLYGPLKLYFKMMELTTDNREEVLTDIKEWGSVDMRINLMSKHMSPLTHKWLSYRDIIRNLLEQNSGLIKDEDFILVSDFIDGCIKREIIEEGKNVLAVNESRTNKLLEAVKNFQKKLL